jgi:hypothetical protein
VQNQIVLYHFIRLNPEERPAAPPKLATKEIASITAPKDKGPTQPLSSTLEGGEPSTDDSPDSQETVQETLGSVEQTTSHLTPSDPYLKWEVAHDATLHYICYSLDKVL